MTFLGIDLPSFGTPEVLWLLLVPGLLLAWGWANRWLIPSRRVVLPVDRATGGGGWFWYALIGLADCLPPLLLAVGILILAGPQKNGPPQQKRKMTNIQFAVDVSGSMMSSFGGEGTLYDESMKAIDKMLDYRKGDSFGLTFFGDAYVHWVPLTSDPSAIKCAPPFMRPEVAPPAFGGTAIGKAIQACQKLLAEREDGDRMIVLISDGYSYDLYEMADELGRSLEKDNITVFTIIVGGQPQEEIITLCRRTGGEAFSADDPDALMHIFKRIDQMKQAEFRPTFVETVDDFKPYTTAGLILIALGTLALYGLRYTPW